MSSASPAVRCPCLLPVMSSRLPHCLPFSYDCLIPGEEFPSKAANGCFRFLNCQTMSVLQFSALLSSSPPDCYTHKYLQGLFTAKPQGSRKKEFTLFWRNNARREFVSLLSVNSLEKMEIKGIEYKFYFPIFRNR